VLADGNGGRMRRDLSVSWLWGGEETTPEKESEEQTIERDVNRTPKENDGCTVEGKWYNHLGSVMVINSSADGVLHGYYATAVEREQGSAGANPSRLIGHLSGSKDSPTFGFTVVWSNGRSVSSWTGQCHICNGEESLMTTWILTQKMDTCNDYWMSNRIGQDTFKRYEIRQKHRHPDITDIYRDNAQRIQQDLIDEELDL